MVRSEPKVEPMVCALDNPLGVYIHVPYCRVICPYCDFIRARRSGEAPRAFADALIAEIEAYDGPRNAGSVFMGGGTPSLLSQDDFHRIVLALRNQFRFEDEFEFTVEANPDDVTPDLLDCWAEAGVNRVSLGVQSFDDATLAYLGRCHDAGIARAACAMVGERFRNWSLDLIYGAKVPGEGAGHAVETFSCDLDETIELDPPHVSAYALTVEPGTPFATRTGSGVDDETGLSLFELASDRLSTVYQHYEISNFAKPRYPSVHNRIYWRNEAYAGFGPGAVSYIGGVRGRNRPSISGYLRNPGAQCESERLPPRVERVETLIQHLRTRDGIQCGYYAARFGSTIKDDFEPAVAELIERRLLEWTDAPPALRPTATGFQLNDEIGLALVGTPADMRD